MSVQSDLDKIEDIKKDIHTSIKNKGVDISDDTPFENYPSEIDSITGGGSNTSYILKINTIPMDASVTCKSGSTTLTPFESKYYASGDGSVVNYTCTKSGYEDLTNSITLTQHTDLNLILTAKNNRAFVGTNAIFIITPDMDLYASGSANPNAAGATQIVYKFDFVAHNVLEVVLTGGIYGYLNTDGQLYAKGTLNPSSSTFTKDYTLIASNVKTLGHNWGIGTVLAYIDLNDDLYMMGSNDYGQQGSGTSGIVNTLTKRASNVKDFYYYYWASFYITNDADLYICGGDYQQGGGSRYGTYTFTKRAENVKEVCRSDGYGSFYIDLNDDLYGTALEIYPTDKSQSFSFQKWASNVKWAQMVGSQGQLLHYITNDGKLYGSASRCNSWYWIGTGSQTARQLDVLLASDVVSTCMCQSGAAYINTNGDIYICGSNGTYTLTNHTSVFTKKVEGADLLYNIDMSQSNNLIYLKNSYYATGGNGRGKLGIDNDQIELTTFEIVPFNVGE